MRLSSRRRPTKTLLVALVIGVLLAASPIGAGVAAAADSVYVANCTANLRASTSTSSTLVDAIAKGTTVVAAGTVSGAAWSATCDGVSSSGSNWYAILTVAGKSTSTLYGRSVVYAATGLFTLVLPPPPPTTYLEGIDVSHWQGAIDWFGVAYSGKSFAIMKATEGQSYADSRYGTNHAAARANGIRVGAYHFANPDTSANDAILEADWFVQHLAIQPGDLNPALDLETSGGLGTAALQAWVGAWLDEVYAKIGMRPMIYTSPAFWRSYMGDSRAFADRGYTVLWIAHWFVSVPSVPAANWGGRGWTFWQYSDCGSVPGIGGCVDLDRYHSLDLTAVTYDPDFMVSSSPATQWVRQGAATSFMINISRQYFTLPIDLTVSGLPDGATATLDATTTMATSTTLHVATSNTGTITPIGTYPLTISGTGDGVTHSAIANLAVIDGFPPTVTAPGTWLRSGIKTGSTTTPVRSMWAGSDDSSGIGSFGLQAQVNGGAWSWISSATTSVIASTSPTFNAVYRYRVRATDRAGNVSDWAYGPAFKAVLTQQSSSAIAYSSGWLTGYTTYALGGSLKYTTRAGAWASYTFSGAGISWVAYLGPNRGSALVYVDGVYAGTVNLHSSTYISKRIVFATTWASNGLHTIRIVNLATSGHPRINVDAFVRLILT